MSRPHGTFIALVVAAALAAGAPAAAATVATPACQRDVLVADSEVRASHTRLTELANATTKEICPVWRRHIGVARRSAVVYQRCLSGTDQRTRVADMTTTAADLEAAVKAQCK